MKSGPDAENEKKLFNLGSWQVDPGLNRIKHRVDGHEVPLEPKAMDLLVVLATNSGETVSKRHLLEEVWHGAFVVESVIPKAVSALRQALGDNRDNPTYIRTVQRKGYRLVAVVDPVPKPDMAISPTLEAVESTPVSPPMETLQSQLLELPTLSAARRRLLLLIALLSLPLVVYWTRASTQVSERIEQPIARLAIAPFLSKSSTGTSEALTVALRDELLVELARFDRPRIFPIELRPGETDGGLAIAREIATDGLLEGEVQDLGDRIRMDLRLIETVSGRLRWSTSVERSTEELWSFRHYVASALVERLEPQPQPKRSTLTDDRSQAQSAIPQDVYRLYLEARFLWTQRNAGGLNRAHDLFSRVTLEAPEFGPGFAWLALAKVVRSNYLGGDTRVHFEEASLAAERALRLAPDEPMAFVAAGQVAMNFHTSAEIAVTRYQQAIELAPNLVIAQQYLAEALTARGQHELALEAADTAVELDPISPIQHGVRGLVLNAAGRWEEAIEAFNQALVLDGHFWIYRYRAYSRWRLDDQKGAIADFRRFAELAGEDPVELLRLDESVQREGTVGYWKWLIERYQYHESEGRFPRPMEWAEVLAGAGRLEEALTKVQEGATIGQGEFFLQLRVSPAFDALRDDPVYIELYRSAGSTPQLSEPPSHDPTH